MQTTGEKTRRRRNTQKVDPNGYRANTNLVAYPYFSLEERERRWSAVREIMEAARVDCLIVPPSAGPNTLLGASSRYLTQIGGGRASVSLIFPLNREPAAILPDAATWSGLQPWCTDLREPAPSHLAAALVKLKGVGLRRRRIGIVGLDGASDTDEIPYDYVDGLATALPRVTFVDFTDELSSIRERKSPEEVAFLRRSFTMVDAAFEAGHAAGSVGSSPAEIETAAIEALCRLGGDLPMHVAVSMSMAGAPIEAISHEKPSGRGRDPASDPPGARDSPFMLEIESDWAGYRLRAARPLIYAASDDVDLELRDLAAQVWSRTVAAIQPSQTVSRLVSRVETTAGQLAASTRETRQIECAVELYPCGLGNDAPRYPRWGSTLTDKQRVLPDACFSLSITLRCGDRSSRWMEPVLVTERGAQRLATDHQTLRHIEPLPQV